MTNIEGFPFIDLISILTEEELEKLQELLMRIPLEVKCRKRKNLLHYFFREAIEENEMQPIIIYGRRGGGKSTLALKSTAYFFMDYYGLECGEAYLEVFKRLVHTPKEFFLTKSKYSDIIIWDDAGVWLSTYFWYLPGMRSYLAWFFNWYDTSRTDVKVLVFTTPHPKKLPPVVRSDIEVLRVRIRRIGADVKSNRKYKIALAHIVKHDVSDYSMKEFDEDAGAMTYTVRLPDLVYEAYSIIRDGYHRLANKMWEKVMVEKKLLHHALAEEE